MICLGSPQSAPTPFEAQAAQLRIVQLFRSDFLSRYPDGIVISELEYMGRTTAAPNQPGPLIVSGRSRLNQVLAALTEDFRRGLRDRDYRKCDALGISGNGTYAELLEITTVDNAMSAITQVTSKLAILNSVNRIHNLSVDWRPAVWRPSAEKLFFVPSPSSSGSEIRYLCFFPTFRAGAPPGVVLYEVHVAKRPTVPVPVRVPNEVAEQLRQSYRSNPPTKDTADSWARRFVNEHPVMGMALRGLAAVFGAALVVAAIILIFDPIPGDEAAAGAAAMGLLAFAAGSS